MLIRIDLKETWCRDVSLRYESTNSVRIICNVVRRNMCG